LALIEVLEAALAAVEPERLVRAALADLELGMEPATVIAFGKAAPAMARGWAGAAVPLKAGVVVSDHEEVVPPGFDLLVAGHPLPDGRSVEAAERVLTMLRAAPDQSPVLFMISGGGSALLELPAAGVSLADLEVTNRLMLASSLPISALNAVRTALSAVKGGRLGAHAGHLRPFTLVLSDVGLAGAATVASGPTTPPPSVEADLESMLREHQLWDRLPASVRTRVNEAAHDRPAPPPHPIVTLADGKVAAMAGKERARQMGLDATVAEMELAGDAAESARAILASAGPGLTLASGETTVDVGGATGRGGRNQEAGLAAAIEGEGDSGWTLAALATDGIDGNTRAAGAIVDGRTCSRARADGLDPIRCLADHDSHTALVAAGDLLISGPTGTNVADLWAVLRRA
jgi:glycerate-2-kinase